MAQNVDWFREIFERIRVDVDRVKYLEELQIATSTCSYLDLSAIVPNLSLNIIFDCLNTSDKIQRELAIRILKKHLSVLNSIDVMKLYGIPLGRALEHPDVEAKKLVLNELIRAAGNTDLLIVISQETPLLTAVIGECIKSEDLSLASIATQLLNEIVKVPSGVESLLTNPLLELVKRVSAVNDIVKFRIYELVVNISVQSIEGLAASVKSDLLTNLLNDVQAKDILIQLTALETITKLALSDHGFQFLKDKGVLEYLRQQLNDSCALHPLLLPGYMKFFGNVAQVRPREIFAEYHDVINLVFRMYHFDDPVISNVALETIGFICTNPAGKQALNQFDLRMLDVMDMLGTMITLQPTERKVVALNVLTNILQLNGGDQEISNITKKWFTHLCENPIKVIMNVCEKPFGELKLAGFVALNAIAEHAWGQQEINKCPGLVEYLLNRSEDSDMNCKAAKFKIVKTISDSTFSKNIFSSETMSRFMVHVRQGIVYVQARTEIAFEGAT